MIYLIPVLIYLASAGYMYWWIRTIYGENGRWYNTSVRGIDVAVTVVPILNTIWVFFSFFSSPYSCDKDWSWFFNIKKK